MIIRRGKPEKNKRKIFSSSATSAVENICSSFLTVFTAETPSIPVRNPISAPCILLHADPVSVMSRLHFHCGQYHNFVSIGFCGFSDTLSVAGLQHTSRVDRMRQKW
jgi:hypothetical protein